MALTSNFLASMVCVLGLLTCNSLASPTRMVLRQDGRNCDFAVAVVAGQPCSDFANNNHITLENLYDWNPSIRRDASCTGFQLNHPYCVSAPGSSTFQISSSCTARVAPDNPTQSCADFASAHQVPYPNQFYQWNSDVHNDGHCSGFLATGRYCVADNCCPL